jgi:glycosyltransferase involved in cell wall biosynthesis
MKICLISEGSYPIVRGGVSEWTQQLIKGLHFVDFDIFCLAPTGRETWLAEYEKPANVKSVTIQGLANQRPLANKSSVLPKAISEELVVCMASVLNGSPIDCERLTSAVKSDDPIYKAWLTSKEYWDFLVHFYEANWADSDFSEYFWAANGIFSSLLDTATLARQVPNANIYHSLTTGSSGFVGCLAKVIHRRPLVVSEHGLYMKERVLDLAKQDITPSVKNQILNYYKSMVMTCYEQADLLIPVCQDHANKEVELGVDPKKIRVVINGIDSDKFTPGGTKKPGTPMVGCFARVVPVKDQMTLLKAGKTILGECDADFVFAGEIQDAEYYKECQDLVQKLGIGGNIKFIGHSDNMLDLYRRADIFVLSSQSEGVPLALLEAMSCGLPAVCTSVGGVPEILADSVTGFLVQRGDVENMSAKISTLLRDETLRKKMGSKARELVIENYTIGEMSRKILGIYNELNTKETGSNGSS